MPRPSFQFYPADWRSNVKLWRCSEAARGAWISILGVLHDSDEYGVVRWLLAELASVANVSMESILQLVQMGVLKGSDTAGVSFVHTPRHAGKNLPPVELVKAEPAAPCWYSSRMVTDEWRRQRSGGDTKFTTENQPSGKPSRKPGRSPSRRPGNGSSTSSSSSSSVLPKGSTAADAAPSGPRLVHPAPAPPEKPADPKAALYAEMREVCGTDCGGLATQLLAICEGNLLKARGLIYDARGRPDPRAWMMGVIRKRTKDEGVWGLSGMV